MGIQLRSELGSGESLGTFAYGGLAFEILGESNRHDMVPDPSFHLQKQYVARASDGKLYEVYVYYYSKFENGRHYAVVDAIRSAEVDTYG